MRYFWCLLVSFGQLLVFPPPLSFPHITVVCSLLPFLCGGSVRVKSLVRNLSEDGSLWTSGVAWTSRQPCKDSKHRSVELTGQDCSCFSVVAVLDFLSLSHTSAAGSVCLVC